MKTDLTVTLRSAEELGVDEGNPAIQNLPGKFWAWLMTSSKFCRH
jgi:hypothetical protein